MIQAIVAAIVWIRSKMTFRVIVAIVLIAAATVAVAGINSVPLEGHEIYVVQTAKEMDQRGDWMVPYFNEQLRLTKPPLSYWLTLITYQLSGSNQWQAWHGRFPSAVSAVVLVGLTMWIGRLLFTRSVALLAGALTLTTFGYVSLSHNARPDMLYAALCTLGIALFIYAWRRRGGGHTSRIAGYGMWLAFGLATLTKGPHVPLILVASFLLILVTNKTKPRHISAILRPWVGPLILVSIALPWWVALYYTIGRDAFMRSELAGSNYQITASEILNPYYLHVILKYLLPWIVLWPASVGVLFKRIGGGPGARAMLLMIATVMIALTFGRKRWIYLLPILGPACVLMALGARLLFFHATQPGARKSIQRFIPQAYALILSTILMALWLMGTHSSVHLATIAGIFTIAAICFAALWYQRRCCHGERLVANTQFVATALVIIVFFVSASTDGLFWSIQRWQRASFGRNIHEQLEPDVPVAALGASAESLIFYAQRPIHRLRQWSELPSFIDHSPTPTIGLIVNDKGLAKISASPSARHIITVANCNNDQAWSLVTLQKTPPVLTPGRTE